MLCAPGDTCWHARRCKAERLACLAFSLFMGGESPVRWKLIPRQPSRDRYEALLGGGG